MPSVHTNKGVLPKKNDSSAQPSSAQPTPEAPPSSGRVEVELAPFLHTAELDPLAPISTSTPLDITPKEDEVEIPDINPITDPTSLLEALGPIPLLNSTLNSNYKDLFKTVQSSIKSLQIDSKYFPQIKKTIYISSI